MPQCPTGSPMSAIAGGNGVPRAVATGDPKIIFVAMAVVPFKKARSSTLRGFSPLPARDLFVCHRDRSSLRARGSPRPGTKELLDVETALINRAVLDSRSQEIKHIIHIRPLARSSRPF